MATVIRYTTQFDKFTLKLENVRDSFPKAIDKREFPGLDGAELDDLGMNGRTITFRAVFWNDTYETHKDFLLAVQEKNTVHNFVHPYYGLLFGMVSSTNVEHDQRKALAYIDVVFEEQLQGDFEQSITPLITPRIETEFANGQVKQIDQLTEKAREYVGAENSAFLGKTLNAGPALKQLTGLSKKAREWVRNADQFVTMLEGTLATVENPVNSIISTIDYGVTLPGRVIGAIANTVERIAVASSDLITSPVRFFESFYNGVLQLKDSFNGSIDSFLDELTIGAAMFGSLKASYVYDDDERQRDVVRNLESQKAFDILGNRLTTVEVPIVMTVDELEQSLFLLRENIQIAIDLNRDLPELPQMAVLLLSFVNKRKIERDRIVTVDVDPSMPLQLLSLRRGQSYAICDRVLGMNKQIVNPVFSSGEVMTYE